MQILIKKAEQEKTVLTAIVGKFTDRNKEILNFIPKQLGVLLKVRYDAISLDNSHLLVSQPDVYHRSSRDRESHDETERYIQLQDTLSQFPQLH